MNGNFATGDFSGWTLTNQKNPFDLANANSFYIGTPSADTPAINGITFSTAANPLGGSYYAVSTSDLPGAHALLQNFGVPLSAQKITLSWQMFVNDQSGIGPVIDASGLDYLTGGITDPLTGAPLDNQHARVDLLRIGASDLSTNTGDVIHNFYLGVDNPGNAPPNPYLSYAFDITPYVTPGLTYRLRWAEVDNLSALNVGVDNVSVLASPNAVPEPGPLSLLLGLAFGFAVWRRNCSRVSLS